MFYLKITEDFSSTVVNCPLVVIVLVGYICSKSSGSAAFIGLSWTCLLTSRVFSAPEKREGTMWKKMVRNAVYVVVSVG